MSFVKLAVMMGMMYVQADSDLVVPDIGTPPVQSSGWSTYYDLSPASMNGKVMANGQPFLPNQMTIAHRHIPLGTMVLIEHKATRRRVWAEVTDRGPYGAMYEGEWVLKIWRSDPGEWRGVADLSIGVARALTGCFDECKRPPNSHIHIRYWKQKKRLKLSMLD